MTELKQENWEGVYYDFQTAEFVSIDIGEESVEVEYYENSDRETIPMEDFDPDDFKKMPQEVIENPENLIEEAIMNCVEHGYGPDSEQLAFALRYTDISKSE